MGRIALLVGINKYACGSNLNGCIPDVLSLERKLTGLGFSIRKLTDQDATRDNWLTELDLLVNASDDGDFLFHGHSHHGSQEPDVNEPDGLRELWCPYDWPNKITDDDVAGILRKLNERAMFLDWADCCHAAGSTRDLFYKDERPKFIPNGDTSGRWIIKGTPVEVEDRPNIIQFAACRSNQTSADAFIGGGYCGAFTHYALEAWNGPISYGGLIDSTAQLLSRNGYSQCPEFCGTSENAKLQALC